MNLNTGKIVLWCRQGVELKKEYQLSLNCKLVYPDDVPIVIAGYGEGVINAQ